MKNKLFIPTIVLTIAPICSCGPSNSAAQKVADAIFNPFNLEKTKLDKSFLETIKDWTQEQKNNELIYDLFIFANYNNQTKTGLDKTLREYYFDDSLAIQTNITKKELIINDNNELIANFLGYVSFVFVKDINDQYKANDYFMFTYDIKNLKVNVNADFLSYKPNDDYCLGFVKISSSSGQEGGLIPITSINNNTFEFGDLPHNSQNLYAE